MHVLTASNIHLMTQIVRDDHKQRSLGYAGKHSICISKCCLLLQSIFVFFAMNSEERQSFRRALVFLET